MNKECKIGTVQLNNPFILAPLAGITDAPFRRICGEMGAGLVYSEMVSAKGLWYKDKNTDKLLDILPGEAPVAYQIFGHEPEIMAEAVRMLNRRPNVLLDINMGCPVPKIVRNEEGSALMRKPDLVYEVVRAAVGASEKPVTVKIRAGWNSDEKNAVEVAKAIEAGGAAAVAVHGRTREQFYSGSADWNIISEVKQAVSIPVIGNGDVVDLASARRMMQETGCDFVMIGRGALGNPWIFEQLAWAWQEGSFDPDRGTGESGGASAEPAPEKKPVPAAPDRDAKIRMMLRHFNDIEALKGEYTAVREMRKHVGWYLKGMPGAAAFRGKVNQINDAAALREAIQRLADPDAQEKQRRIEE